MFELARWILRFVILTMFQRTFLVISNSSGLNLKGDPTRVVTTLITTEHLYTFRGWFTIIFLWILWNPPKRVKSNKFRKRGCVSYPPDTQYQQSQTSIFFVKK